MKETPLIQAKTAEIAAALIRAGANVNLRGYWGNTALDHQDEEDEEEKRIRKLLLKHGAKTRKQLEAEEIKTMCSVTSKQ